MARGVKEMGRDFTVPTRRFIRWVGSNFLDVPQSITFIELPLFVSNIIFSGFRSLI
jgi:hypothetical protein